MGHYDAIIIGAGMSGLAAGIRLAMFDKKVLIVERHVIPGGLNSYYTRRIPETKELINFDVGLHALTNFARPKEKGRPFTKLLKQLRLPYDAFELQEQTHSLIKFASASLKFSNEFELLQSEVAKTFPGQIDQFNKLVDYIRHYNEVDLKAQYISAREVMATYLQEELLQEMLIAPLLIYGSSWENDMDFSQFVIMFKSLYFEGFSRPKEGVRTIIELLTKRYTDLGGEIRYRAEVESIAVNEKVKGVTLKKGEFLEADKILSSAGLPETYAMLDDNQSHQATLGKLSFTETIFLCEDKSILKDFDTTICFYNSTDKYHYHKPNELYDTRSAVFCLPDNYDRSNHDGYATIRVTNMANYELWKELGRKTYLAKKENVYLDAVALTESLLQKTPVVVFKDVFTPTTVEKYTKHFKGTVYGSETKLRDGKTHVDGLYVIGTDQGFLGIVGSILSGISMANLHGLMEGN